MLLVMGSLMFEHALCRSGDVQRINIAFFQMNALVGLILLLGVGASIYLLKPGFFKKQSVILSLSKDQFRRFAQDDSVLKTEVLP